MEPTQLDDGRILYETEEESPDYVIVDGEAITLFTDDGNGRVRAWDYPTLQEALNSLQ